MLSWQKRLICKIRVDLGRHSEEEKSYHLNYIHIHMYICIILIYHNKRCILTKKNAKQFNGSRFSTMMALMTCASSSNESNYKYWAKQLTRNWDLWYLIQKRKTQKNKLNIFLWGIFLFPLPEKLKHTFDRQKSK
jgi:hypothetical protein